jgi:hypothetical protein
LVAFKLLSFGLKDVSKDKMSQDKKTVAETKLSE